MNQNDRRILRREAALEIESGRTLSQVARKYGRTTKWVREACIENEVVIPSQRKDRISEIIEKKNEGKRPSEIGREIGVSRQYVYQVLTRLT